MDICARYGADGGSGEVGGDEPFTIIDVNVDLRAVNTCIRTHKRACMYVVGTPYHTFKYVVYTSPHH